VSSFRRGTQLGTNIIQGIKDTGTKMGIGTNQQSTQYEYPGTFVGSPKIAPPTDAPPTDKASGLEIPPETNTPVPSASTPYNQRAGLPAATQPVKPTTTATQPVKQTTTVTQPTTPTVQSQITAAKSKKAEAEIAQTKAETTSIINGMAVPQYNSRDQAQHGVDFVPPSSPEIYQQMTRGGQDYEGARATLVQKQVERTRADREKQAREEDTKKNTEAARSRIQADLDFARKMGRPENGSLGSDPNAINLTKQSMEDMAAVDATKRSLRAAGIDPDKATSEQLKAHAGALQKEKDARTQATTDVTSKRIARMDTFNWGESGQIALDNGEIIKREDLTKLIDDKGDAAASDPEVQRRISLMYNQQARNADKA
ncbi:hypothetical protein EBT16_14425, partial [bacterium]|nr:hypothetical protein [bacterium]